MGSIEKRKTATRVVILGGLTMATILTSGAISLVFAGLAIVAAYDLGLSG